MTKEVWITSVEISVLTAVEATQREGAAFGRRRITAKISHGWRRLDLDTEPRRWNCNSCG
jgi:hypothetical protein